MIEEKKRMELRFFCGNQLVGIKKKVDSNTWVCYLFEPIPNIGKRFSYVELNTANLWRKKRND